MFMKSKNYMLGIMVVFVLFLAAYGFSDTLGTVSRQLGVDIPYAQKVSHYDDHGGFHGDGTSCIVLKVSAGQVLDQIKENTQWKQFTAAADGSLPDPVDTLAGYLTDAEGTPLLPSVNEGYYILIDRGADPGMASGADMFHRSSFNFTLGIYDTENNTLYVGELDT